MKMRSGLEADNATLIRLQAILKWSTMILYNRMMQHENQNVKSEITVRQRLKQLLQSPPSFLWKSSLSTQQLIRVDSDPVVSSTDHVRQWNMHIPTHPDIPRRTVMSEPSSWGSSSEWEDTEGWCCVSGTRNRNYPSPDSHQSGGGSKGSFTIFDNEASMIFEYFWAMPKMTTHRIPMFIFSILVRVSSAAESYKCYKDHE